MTINDVLVIAKKVGIAYEEACKPLLCEFDLLQPSLDILMFLARTEDGGYAKDISETRFIKPNVVSLHVEKLVQDGYVQRNPVEGDRRKIRLTCTEKAREIIEKGKTLQEGFIEKLLLNISQKELDTMGSVIERLGGNAERISDCSR